MRTWPGLAAIGAGLVHLGIAAGSGAALLVLLVVVGAAETLWGIVALGGVDRVRPRLALAVGVALVALQVVLLTTGHRHGAEGSVAPPPGALLGAAFLDLAAVATIAVGVRRGSAVAEPGPLRFLLGTAIGAGIVAVAVATSLAGTAVGGSHAH